MNSGRGVVAALALAGLLVCGLSAPVAAQEPASAVDDAVCGWVADLDELISEFGLVVGGFEDDRLNRALAKAVIRVHAARTAAVEGDVVRSFHDFRAAVRWLERGASVPTSGNGFADDLASHGTFFAERSVLELITAVMDSSVDLESASAAWEAGVAARVQNEWAEAAERFARAVKTIGATVDGSGCSTPGGDLSPQR